MCRQGMFPSLHSNKANITNWPYFVTKYSVFKRIALDFRFFSILQELFICLCVSNPILCFSFRFKLTIIIIFVFAFSFSLKLFFLKIFYETIFPLMGIFNDTAVNNLPVHIFR